MIANDCSMLDLVPTCCIHNEADGVGLCIALAHCNGVQETHVHGGAGVIPGVTLQEISTRWRELE